MTTRNTLGLTAAGALTFAAVLLGSGHTFAQEPSASPAAAVDPAPAASPGSMMDGTYDGMSGMDAQDMASMMGTMMGHMMASMMSEMTGGPGMHGSGWGDPGPSMGHDPQGMGGSGDASDHQACLDMMNEMMAMMSGSMMGGQGPDSSPGTGMGTEPAPSTGPAASPAAGGVDDASHHPAPSPSPAA